MAISDEEWKNYDWAPGMSIFNDKEFRAALAATDSILPRSLWAHLNHIAQYIALLGAPDEALDVWKFAYSGLVLVPEQDTAFGDCSVTALCRFLKHEDFSQGRPRSSYAKEGADLEHRFGSFDHEMRKRLTMDKWSPLYHSEAIDSVRQAFDLCRPPRGQRFFPHRIRSVTCLKKILVDHRQAMALGQRISSSLRRHCRAPQDARQSPRTLALVGEHGNFAESIFRLRVWFLYYRGDDVSRRIVESVADCARRAPYDDR